MTTEQKHKPRSWYKAAPGGEGDGYHTKVRCRSGVPGGNVVVAIAVGRSREDSERNADLIAAAPDMLIALHFALNALAQTTQDSLFDAAKSAIRAAITKAEQPPHQA